MMLILVIGHIILTQHTIFFIIAKRSNILKESILSLSIDGRVIVLIFKILHPIVNFGQLRIVLPAIKLILVYQQVFDKQSIGQDEKFNGRKKP
jgi:hypothetical protein